ncbi:hypothetical protein N7507_004392 [Penicillium longicatenatum]|nr:hypothetical protein N7507_004392 [Penicillium longicatenatum]
MPKAIKLVKQKYEQLTSKSTGSQAPLKGESDYWRSADSKNRKPPSSTAVSSFSQRYRPLSDSYVIAGDAELAPLARPLSAHLNHNYEIDHV